MHGLDDRDRRTEDRQNPRDRRVPTVRVDQLDPFVLYLFPEPRNGAKVELSARIVGGRDEFAPQRGDLPPENVRYIPPVIKTVQERRELLFIKIPDQLDHERFGAAGAAARCAGKYHDLHGLVHCSILR